MDEVLDERPPDPVEWTLVEDDEAPSARMLLPGGRRQRLAIPEGGTVRDLLAAVPTDLHSMVRVFCNGTLVADWETFRFRRGDNVLAAVVPQGGGDNNKGIVGAILMIVVAVVAWYAAPILFGAYGAAAVAVGQAAITMVGSMVIGALIKPPALSTGALAVTGGAAVSKSYMLTGQSNQPRPYSACMVIYGQYKVMPVIANNPDVDNWGSSSTMSVLYDFGMGYVNFTDLRIGDVDIAQYTPQLVGHWNSYCDDLRLCPSSIGYDQYAINLLQNDPHIVTTKADTIFANLDFQFPRGLFQATAAGAQLPFWADFRSRWRRVGDPVWTDVPIDWYYGAAQREFANTQVGIEFEIDGWGNWTNYDPATGPGKLREMSATWVTYQKMQPGNEPGNPYDPYVGYRQSHPNAYLTFRYPNGPIQSADYFWRYPEIASTGWDTNSTPVGYASAADYHFQAIGSREARDPGVTVTIDEQGGATGVPYNTTTTPTWLHSRDKAWYSYGTDIYAGGWAWIDGGGVVDARIIPPTPYAWRITDASAWDPAVYVARYPDVAYAGPDAWTHFTTWGAFEGRDPYALSGVIAIRLTQCYVGPYWMRIFLQFPGPGTYEVEMMRTDRIRTGQDPSLIQTGAGSVVAQYNECTVALMRSYEGKPPLALRFRHTMLEMRVTATDQLNGVVQNLSAIAVSVLPVTNDGANFWYAETRNPAWIVLDLLTSEKNPRPLPRDQIDWPSWLYLAVVCDALRSYVVNGTPYTGPRYTCDIVVTDFSTVKELAESVLAGCHASMMLTSAGKWGVLYDEAKTVPRQLLTPANSWGFSGVRTFSDQPHALRVNFVNRENGWARDEVIVYWDGYNQGNATKFETLDTFGITDYPHAWSFGRYMMAQGILRSELFSLSLDVENLLLQRGDLVYVAHDVPRVGGVPVRVVESVPGGGIRVDQILSRVPTGYAVRLSSGLIRTGAVNAGPGVPEGWFVLDNNNGVAPDDLIVLGEFDRVTQPYLLQHIAPGADLTAELTLCKYDAAVYNADQGALPPWDPGFGNDFLNGTDLVSFDLVVTQTLYYVERMPMVQVTLRWQTSGYAFHHHEIALILPSGERGAMANPHIPNNFEWVLDALSERQYFDIALQFEVVPVSSLGFHGAPAYVSIVLAFDKTPPPPVIAFGVNVQKETVDIFWQMPDAPDIAYFSLRYTPEVQYPNWEASQPLMNLNWPNNKTSAGARTGCYGIRVVDTSGNVSDVVWRRTTVAVLPDINVITSMNDRDLFPERWPGKKSHVVVEDTVVQSEGDFGAVYPEGIYYFAEPVDLGNIEEARITSKIMVYGVTADDYMSMWPSLADVASLAGASSAHWNAWLEVSTADTMMMMADWLPSISVIDPIAGANDGEWSAWRPVQVLDVTGQLLRFRIILQSKNPAVRVVCSSGRVEVDMPDRTDTYGDLQVPLAGGLDWIFPVAFRHLESVAVTIDGNADPVVAVVTNKRAEGVHVALQNTLTGAPAAGQIDLMCEGYGRRRLESI